MTYVFSHTTAQRAKDCRYGNRLPEHSVVLNHPEAGLSTGRDRPTLPLPNGVHILPDVRGHGAYRRLQVPPEAHEKGER